METPKLFTSSGKPVARYTMVVRFRKECQRVNEGSGEIIERWTYRSDAIVEAYTAKGMHFPSPLDAMNFKYQEIRTNCTEIKCYDNSAPVDQQLLFIEKAGAIKYSRKKETMTKITPNSTSAEYIEAYGKKLSNVVEREINDEREIQ